MEEAKRRINGGESRIRARTTVGDDEGHEE
jgi:hypothetical protein